MREKIEDRTLFSYEDKKRILKKSDGKCAHCGENLTYKNMTIEHVIPLSKGGTNEDRNLVALCKNCNNDKDDNIINPIIYYKYIQEQYIKDLKKQHDAYCEDVTWLTTKQYTKEDRLEVRYTSKSFLSLNGHNRKCNKEYILKSGVSQVAVLSKANYTDLKAIHEYLKKYHKKMNLDVDDLEETISQVFRIGCIYILRKGSEIIGLFPVSIKKQSFKDSEGNFNAYVMHYSGIPVLYQKSEYIELILKCITRINEGIARANGKNIAVYAIDRPVNDEFLTEITDILKQYGSHQSCTIDNWTKTLFNQRIGCGEDHYYNAEPYKDLEYFSKALERIMHLLPANKTDVQKPMKGTTLTKKSRNMSKERKRYEKALIDEYDERYYQCC